MTQLFIKGTPNLQNVTDINSTTTRNITVGSTFPTTLGVIDGDTTGLTYAGTPFVGALDSSGYTMLGNFYFFIDPTSGNSVLSSTQNDAVASNVLLNLVSTTAGLGVPVMTTSQKNAISPRNGTVVYDSTLNKLCVRAGGAWQTITSV